MKSDISGLLLKGIAFENVSSKEIIEQIEAKKRCEKKLPTWFNTQGIYFPNKLNIEQTSSEKTADYKAKLVSGKSLIDLTGGFGIDSYYFSKQIETVVHCEINKALSEITSYNYNALNALNITCLNENGIDALKRLDKPFDWIYLDPSRRDATKKKVFLLADCEPNVKTFKGLFLKYAESVMIKTSPLLDIKASLNDINNVKEIHIVAVNNEVKELLWLLKRDYVGDVRIRTVNITKPNTQKFDFIHKEEAHFNATYSLPKKYLFEPNASILKAGAFNSISYNLNLNKLHKHSHLYTSDELIDFPGRQFVIQKVIPFNKKLFSKEGITKANITTRNFPVSVNDIRKKLKIKDGGDLYLFFTTDIDNKKIILKCTKV
ncbi:class I SAM-dependent methyltransferase [Winogradskyella sp.]|uniref:THUMP-like domain-containing protein n=1 Tax=Winogradskyella sp. TaxID=1883156 RepID=UPI003458B00C